MTESMADVLAALGRLDGAIDAPAMRRMNLEIDERGADPAEVAADFLRGLGPEPAP